MNEIIDEILNSGIGSEDTILHLGAGFQDGILLETLSNYWDIIPMDYVSNGGYVGVDVDPLTTSKMNAKFDTDGFVTDSFQNYLDTNVFSGKLSDWIVLTGVFNNNDYEERQYDYLLESVGRCVELSEKGVVFTLNPLVSENFSYSVVFIFTQLISTYSKVFAKKINDNSYVFTILN